jgi:hypothetical protein
MTAGKWARRLGQTWDPLEAGKSKEPGAKREGSRNKGEIVNELRDPLLLAPCSLLVVKKLTRD